MKKHTICYLLALKQYLGKEVSEIYNDDFCSDEEFIKKVENGLLINGDRFYLDTIDGNEYVAFVSEGKFDWRKKKDINEIIFLNLENGNMYSDTDAEFPDLMKKFFNLDYDEDSDEYVFNY